MVIYPEKWVTTMNYRLLSVVFLSLLNTPTTALAGDFNFGTEISVDRLDKAIFVLNAKAPNRENAMETITHASRDGRILVEEITLTSEADNAIHDFSVNKLKQLLYDATRDRYCDGDMKFLMEGNVSLRLIFSLHQKEFYRVLQTPFSCTIVN
ncbi:hypothetical protein AA105894_0483 [Asaia spathodeae NBRC 105894]|nr:hypothetical protein AA105894_0483 [Asaia spathodeae NBRC 105894]